MKLFGGSDEDPVRVTFMCVENAGRSQMAEAIAEHECEKRGLSDHVEIRSAGTHPADEVAPIVVDVMMSEGFDFADRSPSLVQLEELKTVDYLVTMGCYVSEFDPASFGVDSRKWVIQDPADQDPETVRGIRTEIEGRVGTLFDDIEASIPN